MFKCDAATSAYAGRQAVVQAALPSPDFGHSFMGAQLEETGPGFPLKLAISPAKRVSGSPQSTNLATCVIAFDTLTANRKSAGTPATQRS